jgi:hypothetical protein
MSRGARLLVLILVGAVLLVTAGVGVATAAIVRGGTVALDTHDADGREVSVHVPAALIDLALLLVPDRTFSLALEQAALEHAGRIEGIDGVVPALRDAWGELAAAPDFTLVEVRDDADHVLVQKRGGNLVVQVEGDDLRLDLSVPLRTVSRALRKI